MHIANIPDMREKFRVPVGLSDHSAGDIAAIVAVSMGACVVEKHMCLSRNIPNPDAAFSMEPAEFKKMVVYVDFELTLFAFIPLIFIAIGCYFYGIESKKRQVKRQDAFSYLSDKVQESIAGIRVVKAFAQEEEDFKQFEKACENSREKNLAVVKLRAVFGPALDAVIGKSDGSADIQSGRRNT